MTPNIMSTFPDEVGCGINTKHMDTDTAECCPVFVPEKWNDKTFVWTEKPFIRTAIPTLFHIPLPWMIGKNVSAMMGAAEKAGALEADKGDILLLFCDPSPFRSEMFLSVTKDVPGAENTTISGTFLGKVYDGPYNAAPRFMKEMDAHLATLGKKAAEYMVHYAYCPKCAKKFGHNYAILFARV